MKIRCLIIDDEPSSQLVLKKFIADVEFLELITVCYNAVEAIQELNKNSIDLLLLDINMPKISGISFYKSLQNPPDVIFTTAYSQYAVDGFEVNAIDYLLKPFSFDRFLTAVNKVVERRFSSENKLNKDDYILVKANKTLHKIATKTIYFIEAYGDYVKIHLEDHMILTNNTFTSVLEVLPKSLFVRTHKSFAINVNQMNSISGNQILITNHKIPIGQKYKAAFLKCINSSKTL